MRLISFELDGKPGYGALVDDGIVRLDLAPDAAPDLKTFIASCSGCDSDAHREASTIPMDAVTLLPPIPNPNKVLCVATNFREGKPDPEYPTVFTRFGDSFTGHGSALRKPQESEKFDFEGELAVVIGRPAYRIAREQAMNHVAGYTCLNDATARDWQRHSSQFTPGKNFYRSGSLGPCLVTADEVPDVSALRLQARINGEVKQDITLDRMIFDIPWLISYFSTFTPLSPGDIIATGTPSGFGSQRTPQEFLNTGDTIEVEVTGIGVLRNTVG